MKVKATLTVEAEYDVDYYYLDVGGVSGSDEAEFESDPALMVEMPGAKVNIKIEEVP